MLSVLVGSGHTNMNTALFCVIAGLFCPQYASTDILRGKCLCLFCLHGIPLQEFPQAVFPETVQCLAYSG